MVDGPPSFGTASNLCCRKPVSRLVSLHCNGAVLELGFGVKAMVGVCVDHKLYAAEERRTDLQSPITESMSSFSRDAKQHFYRKKAGGSFNRGIGDVLLRDLGGGGKGDKEEEGPFSSCCQRLLQVLFGD